MTPGARLQAAIEILAAIDAEDAPADRVLAAYLRNRRYIGGGDRREILERVYGTLRRRGALDWWISHAGGALNGAGSAARIRLIADLVLHDGWSADQIAGSFDGGRHRPMPLDDNERRLARALTGQSLACADQPDWVRLDLPEWLIGRLRRSLGRNFEREAASLRCEAPVDLRVNRLKATRDQAAAALADAGVLAVPTALSPQGLRLTERLALNDLDAFRQGLIEVQDEGSQIMAALVDARPGQHVLDLCAGAGGKTLALAAAMANKGLIVACDTSRGRLERSKARLKRAGVHNVECRALAGLGDRWLKRHDGRFDRVLVDAPCSGTGTWRRNPDAKWRLSPADIDELARLQKDILERAARLVKPGGRLIYGTCSLLAEENQDQVEGFLGHHPEFRLIPAASIWRETIGGEAPVATPMLLLTPAAHGTDGFFIAILERQADALGQAGAA